MLMKVVYKGYNEILDNVYVNDTFIYLFYEYG